MKKLIVVSLGLLLLFAAVPGQAKVKNHALPKIAHAAFSIAAAGPKATAVGLKDTLGGILFTAEAVVDVAHAATKALSAAGDAELKKNPFEYLDEGVAKVDTGLERAYLFFFKMQI